MKNTTYRGIGIATLILFIASTTYSTIGLGTRFGTIVLEKLEPGGVYNITRLRSLPLIVINSGSSEVNAAIEIEKPSESELKEGYEPIPDPSWVRVVPDRFKLMPGEEMRCEVIISIPDDKKLIGKHYQLKIWSHTVGEDAFGAGVVNRMFFSIGTLGPETLQRAKRERALFAVEMDVSPDKLYLTVPVGRKVNITKELEKSILVVNKSKVDLTVKVESVENKLNFPLPEGYIFTPDTRLLTFRAQELKVKKFSVKDVDLLIKIPDEEKYRGAKLMFIVKVTPIKPELPMEFYSRIFVTVSEK